jgi:hypothetical protein
MQKSSEKAKKENTKYLVKTNIGRRFIVSEEEYLEYVDNKTLKILRCHPSESEGKYTIIEKPIPEFNVKKSVKGHALTFKLGYLIGLILTKSSSKYKYEDRILLYFRHENRSRLTLSSSELIRHRKLFKKCKSKRFKKFLKDIKGERIRRLTDWMPLPRDVSSEFRLGCISKARDRLAHDDARARVIKMKYCGDNPNAERWAELALNKNIRFEKFGKPVKIFDS